MTRLKVSCGVLAAAPGRRCTCFSDRAKYPEVFGSFTGYTIEGKTLGACVEHFPGKKVACRGRDDDVGNYGYTGLTQVLSVVSGQSYDPATLSTGLASQISAAKAAGAEAIVSFSIPAATALELPAEAAIGYHPAMVVSEAGSDPGTLGGLLSSFSKGKATGALDNGLVMDSFESAPGETSNPWVQLAISIYGAYDANEPIGGFCMSGFDTAVLTYDAFEAAGRNPARQGIVSAIEEDAKTFAGPWLAPLGFAVTSHDAACGVQMRTPKADQLILPGPILTATGTTTVPPAPALRSAVPTGF